MTMSKDMKAQEYFLSRRPDSGSMRMLYSRIARAVYMHGGVSMKRLCEMSGAELEKIRGVGDKARTVIMDECGRYLKTDAGKTGCNGEE